MSKNYYFPQFLLLVVICVYFYSKRHYVTDLVRKAHSVRTNESVQKPPYIDTCSSRPAFTPSPAQALSERDHIDPPSKFLAAPTQLLAAKEVRKLGSGTLDPDIFSSGELFLLLRPKEESQAASEPSRPYVSVGIPTSRRGQANDNSLLTMASVKNIYDGQIGVREIGNNAGSAVEQYLNYVNLKKGEPWCAAFVCWVFGQADVPNPRTGWSPTLFANDKIIWDRGKQKKPPRTADIFAIYFPEKGRIAHTGFVDRWEGNWLTTVEGNTNEGHSREGDGVYRKRRMVRSIYKVARYIN